MPIGVGPRFLPADELASIRQLFRGDEALERRQPMLVVARAVVRFPAVGSSYDVTLDLKELGTRVSGTIRTAEPVKTPGLTFAIDATFDAAVVDFK